MNDNKLADLTDSKLMEGRQCKTTINYMPRLGNGELNTWPWLVTNEGHESTFASLREIEESKSVRIQRSSHGAGKRSVQCFDRRGQLIGDFDLEIGHE